MKQIIVGTYELGFDKARLILRSGTGGHGDTLPTQSDISEIDVGADQEQWWKVLRSLLHETYEMAALKCMCHYSPNNSTGDDRSVCLIVMDHAQFSEINGRVADYVSRCLTDLREAWEKWQANPEEITTA